MQFHNRKINNLALLKKEESLIKNNYTFLTCSISNKILKVSGSNKPSSKSQTYKFEIVYDILKSNPKVFIKDPLIDFNDDIHIYPKDNSLCFL